MSIVSGAQRALMLASVYSLPRYCSLAARAPLRLRSNRRARR